MMQPCCSWITNRDYAILFRTSPDDFKNNVLALADTARYFKLPTILTTSFEDVPKGPLLPELKELFPNTPYIARPGQINAWDNERFRKGNKGDGKEAADHCRHCNGSLCCLSGIIGT